MKLSRHKFVRRWLNYYATHFNLIPPFVVLIDGTFAFEALKWKIQIDEQLIAYLETEQVRCSTTLCAIRETELLGPVAFGAMLILKQYNIVQCHHHPAVSAEKCFQHVLLAQRTSKYFLASQSPLLREFSREHRPDLPTLLITHNAINLERPSSISRSVVDESTKRRLNLTRHETTMLKQIKHDLHLDDQDKDDSKKKKKKKSGINPLSVKKKKAKKDGSIMGMKVPKKKRRRTRQLRVAPHVREHLKELKKTFSIRQFLGIESF